MWRNVSSYVALDFDNILTKQFSGPLEIGRSKMTPVGSTDRYELWDGDWRRAPLNGLRWRTGWFPMPVSGLAYYFSAISADDFGHDNSAYGTEPDIYSSLSYEQYMYYYDMLESGEDSESVGGLLKYDQVFITAYDEALKSAA